MRATTTIATKLVYAGLWLLLAVTASIGVTLWVTWQLEGGAAAVNEAGRLRMQVWRLDAARTLSVPAERREALVQELVGSLERLRAGDPKRPLFVPWTPLIRERFDAVEATWNRQRHLWDPQAPPDPTNAGVAFAIAEMLVAQVDELVLAIESEGHGLLLLFRGRGGSGGCRSIPRRVSSGYRIPLQKACQIGG